ncbi:MAG: MTH1187 family thiamine-binding protein [Candidatus Bathyarchaeia archaeon]
MPKHGRVIADLSIIPVGVGTSIGKYLGAAIAAIDKLGNVRYQITPMSTILEAESIDDIFRAAKCAHEAVIGLGAQRVECELRIDDRRDKLRTLEEKVEAVREYAARAKAS